MKFEDLICPSARPKPVKLIGNLVDTCQVTMAILLDFLTDSADEEASAIKKCSQSMPSLVDVHPLQCAVWRAGYLDCQSPFCAASPVTVEKQVAIIYLGMKGLLKNVPVNKIAEFEELFLLKMEQLHPEALKDLQAGKLSDEATSTMEKLAGELAQQFS